MEPVFIWESVTCISVVPVAQTFGDVCETKPYDTEDISRSVTVTVEEDQINTPACSPGAFIRHYDQKPTSLQRIGMAAIPKIEFAILQTWATMT